jgi:ferredoxin
VACGFACPSGAIRPFTLDEKLGRGDFSGAGPLKVGCAFLDRGRCLPWSMGRPCIVCQEVCPTSPKAITVEVLQETVREGPWEVLSARGATLRVQGPALRPGRFAGGDHRVAVSGAAAEGPVVVDNGPDTLVLASAAGDDLARAGTRLEVRVRLQRPWVDPGRCTGCGICEHACPVVGRRAIRVTPENESRDPRRTMTRG